MAKKSAVDAPVLDVKNSYDRFALDFLRTDEHGDIWNGNFRVTETTPKLLGVPEKDSEVRLIDYLVYRPIPKELIYARTIPDYDPNSLDMEHFYRDVIEWSVDGVWVDGEYFNPFFVYWMNIFVFPIYILDEDGNPTEDFEAGHPYYCNIDRYVFDICWKAEINRRDVALMGGRGIGKAVGLETVIPTTLGYKLAKDINISDILFDRQGHPTKVLDIFPHKNKKIYRVTLKDGRSLDVCDEHLWGVYDHSKKYSLKERYEPTKRNPKGS